MDKTVQVLQIILPVIIMLALGMLCRRKQLISEEGVGNIKRLLVNICIPAVVFKTFYSTRFSPRSFVLVVILFAVTVAALRIGGVLNGRLRINEDYFPYLCTSIEGGMMGFALFILLFGQNELYHLALLDLGNALVLFPVLVTRLRLRQAGEKTSRADVARSLVTPINVAIALGILISVTGLGGVVTGSSFGMVLDAVLSFVGGPVSALILLVVGYGLSFERVRWNRTLRTIAARVVIMGIFGTAVFLIAWALFPQDIIYRYGVIMAFVLPPSYMYSMFTRDESEEAYVGAVLALYTVITIIGFIILTIISAG